MPISSSVRDALLALVAREIGGLTGPGTVKVAVDGVDGVVSDRRLVPLDILGGGTGQAQAVDLVSLADISRLLVTVLVEHQ